jgi:hypothetical protein
MGIASLEVDQAFGELARGIVQVNAKSAEYLYILQPIPGFPVPRDLYVGQVAFSTPAPDGIETPPCNFHCLLPVY